MTSDSFKMNGAMNADNPNTAALMKRMLSGLIDEGKSAVTDKNAKSVFDQVKLFTEGDELHAEVSVPQEMAAKLVREMLAPSPAKAAATGTKATTKPGTRSRRSRRKT